MNRVRRVHRLHLLLFCHHWAPPFLPAILGGFSWLGGVAWLGMLWHSPGTQGGGMLVLELRVAADCRRQWLTTVDGVAAGLKGNSPIGCLRDGWKVKVFAVRCGQGCKVSAASTPGCSQNTPLCAPATTPQWLQLHLCKSPHWR